MAVRYFLSDGSVCLSGFANRDSPDGREIGMVSSIISADLGFETRGQLDRFIESLDEHQRSEIERYNLVPMEIEVAD